MDTTHSEVRTYSTVKVLGTGGFRNCGLPFNAYIIDDSILIETPPDIIQSLYREHIPLADITTIVITHFHGDHCFGLPFLVLNLQKRFPDGPEKKIRLVGPRGIGEKAIELLSLAIKPDCSYIGWFKRHIEVVEIDETSVLELTDGRSLTFFRVIHSPENYALALWSGRASPDFLYISDTSWGPEIAALFAMGSSLVFCDSNGGAGDEVVHMSARQIQSLGLPLAGDRSRVMGSHVSTDDAAMFGDLPVIKPGDVFRV